MIELNTSNILPRPIGSDLNEASIIKSNQNPHNSTALPTDKGLSLLVSQKLAMSPSVLNPPPNAFEKLMHSAKRRLHSTSEASMLSTKCLKNLEQV